MKQLTDNDLAEMAGAEFAPDDRRVKKQVRGELRLSRLIPEPAAPAPRHAALDLHQKTEEQAWAEINALLASGTRTAVIITGASGILKTKFQDWAANSVIAPRIVSCKMINNGSFEIRIKYTAQAESACHSD
jgi:DNA-nicking Smr family endonuclease